MTFGWVLKGERDFFRYRYKEKGIPSTWNSMRKAWSHEKEHKHDWVVMANGMVGMKGKRRLGKGGGRDEAPASRRIRGWF